ncbi:MAG: hypothetical protein P1U39_07235 [Legionellaceae bacterium]|nr:hypothetical protein [Legionellaceae bacterium]
MERKIPYTLGLVSLVMACSSGYAGTEGQSSGYPDGFMFGAGAGVTEFMNSGTYNTSTNNILNSTNNRSFRFGFMGDLIAGYGRRVYKPFYLGTELGLNIFGTRKTSSSRASQMNVTVVQTEFGSSSVVRNDVLSATTTISGNVLVPSFDIKPGLLVTSNSLLFARVGINYNQIHVVENSTHQSSGTLTTDTTELTATTAGLYSSEKKQLIGLRTGVGFEYLISDNIGLAASYVYAFYNSVNTQQAGTSGRVACDTLEGCHVNGDGTYVASGKSKISDQQALLQLIYHLT